MRRLLCACVFGALTVGGATAAENDIGVAAAVVSKATGTLSSDERTLTPGASLYEDEVIRTESDARVQVLFMDETALTIGADAEITLDEFVFDADRNAGSVAIDAARGAFRFVTGNLQSAAYKIETPMATIGVRGTVLDIHVAPNGAVTVTLVEGGAVITALGGAGAAAGEVGGEQTVTLSSPGETTTVEPGEPPTPPAGESPETAALFGWIRGQSGPIFARVEIPDEQPIDVQTLGGIVRGATAGVSAPTTSAPVDEPPVDELSPILVD